MHTRRGTHRQKDRYKRYGVLISQRFSLKEVHTVRCKRRADWLPAVEPDEIFSQIFLQLCLPSLPGLLLFCQHSPSPKDWAIVLQQRAVPAAGRPSFPSNPYPHHTCKSFGRLNCSTVVLSGIFITQPAT
jgi:hypothetical protein